MKKRIVAFALSVLMVFSLLPMSAMNVFAAGAPVAEVGGTQYETLIDAVNAAAEGQTITMLDDYTIATEKYTVYKMPEGSILNLNGKTLTIPFATAMFAGENITIKNGNIASGADYPLFIGNAVKSTDTRIPTNVTVDGITIADGGINIRYGAELTIKNSTVIQNNYYAIYGSADSAVTVLSGSYSGENGKVDVYAENSADVIVYGGTYTNGINEAFLADGYILEGNTVKEPEWAAETNGNKYKDLQAAIDAATAGDTVKVLKNIWASYELLITKNLTLDLGKFTVTGNNDAAVLRAYAPVADTEIKVVIEATDGGITNYGIGYAIYAGEDLEDVDNTGLDAERTNLTVNGGNYVTNGTDCIRQIMGTCTINDGTYKSNFGRTVLNGARWYGADFVINGGSFYGFNPECVSVWTGFDGNDYTHFYHQHDIIADGKIAEYDDGWYTVVNGDREYQPLVSSRSLCYPTVGSAIQAISDMNDVANLGIITLLGNDTLTVDDALLAIRDDFSFVLGDYTLSLPNDRFSFYETTLDGNRDVVKIKEKIEFIVDSDLDEVEVGKEITVTVKVVGYELIGAEWTFVYNKNVFDLAEGTVDGVKWAAENYTFDNDGEILATYKLVAKAKTPTLDNVFSVTNTNAFTAGGAINSDTVISGEIVEDTVDVTSPVYLVEDKSEYVANKRLILVHTNSDEISFAYAGAAMYKVEGRYAHADYSNTFAIVVDAANYDEAYISVVYAAVASEYVLTFGDEADYDLNGTGEFNLRDVALVYGVLNGNPVVYENINIVLKADINGDGIVDVSNDASEFIREFESEK